MGDKIKKYSLDYIVTKTMMKIDENFLIREGVKKAISQGLEGMVSKDKIYLYDNRGKIDVTKLIEIIAKDYPDRIERYLANKKLLSS